MLNQEVAKVFEQIADLLEIKGEDRFRINSYRKVARSLESLTEDVGELAKQGALQKIPGVGKGTAERIEQYLADGRISLHEELLASLPEGLLRLLAIPGLGPKKVGVLYHELQVAGVADLQAAIAAGKVEALPGFGAKSVQKIAEGIEFLARSAGRTPLGIGRTIAAGIREKLEALPGVKRVEVAGSLRRGRETVGDLDLLCEAKDGAAVVEAFTKLPEATGVRASGETKGSILLPNPEGGELQVDLRVVPGESFGAALQYFTGSKEHNVRLRELAVRKGWKLNEYGLFDGDKLLAGRDEHEIYRRLGLAYIPPELREDRGEIECGGKVPGLLTIEDIRGDLHMHTRASDGLCTIEEMAAAAKARGYEYIAITDHSRSSVIANGLSVDRLHEHVAAVRAAAKRIKGIAVLAGVECDILSDGSLDYPEEVLAELDWVVASVHAAQTQSRDRLTGRTLDAMACPHVHVIGHPSGRLINRREAMDLDWERVFEAAARTRTALEVSGAWQRLDLKDVHVRQAMEAGCWLCVDTDAHAIEQLDQMPLGVQTARRGWATADRVVNAQSLPALRKWLAAGKKAARKN